ncbi:zinc dependent phospholipase C family protein [Dyadobacter jejuensis]|nr:zinc dependent phospholipase C family protein [Dyadobacter jejuensis]
MKKNSLFFAGMLLLCIESTPSTEVTWGFWAHKRINYLAVFRLPAEMQGFYKAKIDYITEQAVAPDRRRYAVVGEAEKHYIDLDVYQIDSLDLEVRIWNNAVKRFGADSLKKHGIAPWNIEKASFALTQAFKAKDVSKILRLSADMGHYIADLHVPLHTSENYNGQLTNQVGIHGLWESRLPELFADEYDLWIGPVRYLTSISRAVWSTALASHHACDSVFLMEHLATERIAVDKKFTYELRNNVLTRTYSVGFAKEYQGLLAGQVERRMRKAIQMVGDTWYTCWVNAGQPDLNVLLSIRTQKIEEDSSRYEKSPPLVIRPEP